MNEIIRKNHIKVDVEASDYKEAIFKAGELLLQDGLIQQSYIDKMINAVEKLGPYMVIMPGFALAHANSENDVNENCYSFITLKQPVNFGCPNDPVKVIMALGAIDKTEHIKKISQIATILMNPTTFDEIMNCSDVDRIYEILNK